MNHPKYPIPGGLNIALTLLVSALGVIALWSSSRVESWWMVLLIALAYGFVMNTGNALCHEAEHDIFHPDKRINDAAGTLLSLFVPVSFQLRRQGHLGHHLRNRTDDEAFDCFFAGENPLWKRLQFYGILTGGFWLVVLASNFVAALNPAWLASRRSLDRQTAALQATLHPGTFRRVQLEAGLAILLHGGMIFFFHIPVFRYFVVLFGFGFVWSTLQYIHHYGTVRDVQRGACNVRTWRIFDWICLHHHWHLNHHFHPTVPWIYLPRLVAENAPPPIAFWQAYLRQWRGPRLTTERIANHHAGKLIG